MPEPILLTVAPDEAGLRLDVWLVRRLTAYSRARIQALVRDGHVTLDGQGVKGHRPTRAGETVRVVIPPLVETTLAPEPIPLAILHQDADVIVINKPPGLVVHPAPGHPTGTLVNALLHHCPDLAGIGGERRPGLVHRLDRDTSGVLVVAKNERALTSLARQFLKRRVEKEYAVLVWGRPDPPAGTIETEIGRSLHDRKKMAVTAGGGRRAVTHYETIEALGPVTRLRVRLETGRTHQIRVHLAHRGWPVVGDAQYGRRREDPLPVPVARQMLHAERLALQHPATRQRMAWTAPLPSDMAAVIQALRASQGNGSVMPRS